MAKFQLCMFIRKEVLKEKITKIKKENKFGSKREGWERGLAKVESFNDQSVIFIIDENGIKLEEEPVDWQVLSSYANTTIDTEAV
jgi:hypothetical protein